MSRELRKRVKQNRRPFPQCFTLTGIIKSALYLEILKITGIPDIISLQKKNIAGEDKLITLVMLLFNFS